jgi:hypothetical protein
VRSLHDGDDVDRLRTSWGILNGELYLLTLVERAETLFLDGRVVDENALAAFTGDKSVPFAGTELLDDSGDTLAHGRMSLSLTMRIEARSAPDGPTTDSADAGRP